MGFLDMLTGSKGPVAGARRLSAAEVRTALMALNRDSSPWLVRDGTPEACDLVAEWKIADARWYEIFAKASLSKVFKILMKLDDAKSEVRAVDHEFTVEWRAGAPTLSAAVGAFRGQKTELSFGAAYGFTETLAPGQIYNYRFNTAEMKRPLQNAVTGSGWAWKGVAFGKL